MPEPKRAESSPDIESAAREGRIEALLVDGLDRYFSGQYDEAIHLWTRVLFLDRSQARARAYIDRARTALAEQQRRTEELLHASGELIARGQSDQARDLLAQAMAASGDDARTAAVRWRLEHLERARASAPATTPAPRTVADSTASGRRPWRWVLWAAAATSLVMLAAMLRPGVRASLGLTSPADIPPSAEAVARPILSSTDVALVRARGLYARGRLAEALQALDRVDPASSNRAVADELRVEIQRLLLQTGRGTAFDAQRPAVNRP
jgi:hypothetical protein